MDVPRRARRSDQTRAGILRAAKARFATDGYQKATIRAIAADADIDPSMVMRYYGSKAALFVAAVDVDLRLPDVTGTPPDRLGATLVGHFLSRWERDPGDDLLLMLLRSASTDEAAAARLRDVFAGQVVPLVRGLVPDPAQAPIRANLVATQLLGLALCRAILRLPPIASLAPDAAVRLVAPTIQRYLTGPLDA